MEEHKEQRARLVSLVSTGRTRGNGHKWKHMKFPLTIYLNFIFLSTDYLDMLSSLYPDIQNLTGHRPRLISLSDPAPAGELD